VVAVTGTSVSLIFGVNDFLTSYSALFRILSCKDFSDAYLSICLSANSKYSGLSNKDSKKGLSSTNFS
jgi:hypothetical protein